MSFKTLPPRIALLTLCMVTGIYLSYLQDGVDRPLSQAQDVLNFTILINKAFETEVDEHKDKNR